MNFEAQPLQKHEITAMKADPQILNRILESYRLMLDFYGMQLKDSETGLLERAEPERKWMERYRNLVRECEYYYRTRYSKTFFVQARHTTTSVSRASLNAYLNLGLSE